MKVLQLWRHAIWELGIAHHKYMYTVLLPKHASQVYTVKYCSTITELVVSWRPSTRAQIKGWLWSHIQLVTLQLLSVDTFHLTLFTLALQRYTFLVLLIDTMPWLHHTCMTFSSWLNNCKLAPQNGLAHAHCWYMQLYIWSLGKKAVNKFHSLQTVDSIEEL